MKYAGGDPVEGLYPRNWWLRELTVEKFQSRNMSKVVGRVGRKVEAKTGHLRSDSRELAGGQLTVPKMESFTNLAMVRSYLGGEEVPA
jgi:hypothetical protein